MHCLKIGTAKLKFKIDLNNLCTEPDYFTINDLPAKVRDFLSFSRDRINHTCYFKRPSISFSKDVAELAKDFNTDVDSVQRVAAWLRAEYCKYRECNGCD